MNQFIITLHGKKVFNIYFFIIHKKFSLLNTNISKNICP